MTPKIIYTCPITVRWGDMDAMAHVNNAKYATYFEQARTEWCEVIGSPLNTTSAGMILARLTINYRKPMHFPADIVVELHANGFGRTSFSLPGVIKDAKTGVVYADGDCVLVWFDYVSGKPVALPDRVKAILTP